MAFFVGWMNILAWAVAICGAVSVVVASVAGLIAVWVPAYEISQLQSYLLYLFLAILSGMWHIHPPYQPPSPAHSLSSLCFHISPQ